jgi:DNA-directed RNA polymerase specialized sigma24 family protein
MESAARTAEDFQAVVEQWNHLDSNRERRERDHEVRRNQETIRLGYTDGKIFPVPFSHLAWREARKGDFIEMIHDNAEEIWQFIEDWDVFIELENLSARQKEVLFLTAVRLCTPQQIACCKGQTDRAVRKLLATALDSIRGYLAPVIRWQIRTGEPGVTLERRQFLEWYAGQKIVLDNGERG